MFWIDSVVWLSTSKWKGLTWRELSIFPLLTSERQCHNDGIWFYIAFSQPTELVRTREDRDLQEELQLDLGRSSLELAWEMRLCSSSLGIRKKLQMPALLKWDRKMTNKDNSHTDCCRPIFLMCFFPLLKYKNALVFEKLVPEGETQEFPENLSEGFQCF